MLPALCRQTQGVSCLRCLSHTSAAACPALPRACLSLQVVPPEVQATPEVAQVVQLEQWLMEGAYNKVGVGRGRHTHAPQSRTRTGGLRRSPRADLSLHASASASLPACLCPLDGAAHPTARGAPSLPSGAGRARLCCIRLHPPLPRPAVFHRQVISCGC